jgi:hypothetical protein
MAQWLVRQSCDEQGVELYEVVKDGEALTSVAVHHDADAVSFHGAVRMLRARVIGRLEDPEPVFGFAPDNSDARDFVEMLNAMA